MLKSGDSDLPCLNRLSRILPIHQPRILADTAASLLALPRRTWIGFGVGLTCLLTGMVVTALPQDASAPISQTTILETLPSPQLSLLTLSESQPFVREERILPGDALAALFQRLGIRDTEALQAIQTDDRGRQALKQMRAGRTVFAKITSGGRLAEMRMPMGTADQYLEIIRTNGQLKTVIHSATPVQTLTEMKTAVIKSAFFAAADEADLPDNIASKITDLFGTEIDFTTDLRKGDRFSVIYENNIDALGNSHPGRILAAEFINQGERHAVILYTDSNGKAVYTDEEGRSLQQGFLRTPLEFSRISSGFSTRFHPIFKQWRNHKGVDFAAPTGTPVKASSDGVVDFVGAQNGYGNTIVIQHREHYATAYAHLSNFRQGLTKGQHVSQGEVIGYVGSTGWATGPHLHYEVRINGEPYDPMTVALPAVEPLKGEALAQFKAQAAEMKMRFALLHPPVLAQATVTP